MSKKYFQGWETLAAGLDNAPMPRTFDREDGLAHPVVRAAAALLMVASCVITTPTEGYQPMNFPVNASEII